MESNAVANIAQSIKEGVPPSNKDVEKVIDKTQAVVQKQGYRGAKPEVIENLVAVLEDTRLFLNDKNGDEKIQKFIVHSKEFAKDMQPKAGIPDAEKERAQKIGQRAKDAASNLQQAAIQLITSPDFRDLIYDFIDILREAGMQQVNRNDTGVVEKGKQIQDVNNLSEAKQVATETKDKAVAMAKNLASDIQSGDMKVDEGTKQELSARWNAILKRVRDNESMKGATSAMFALYDELRAGYYDVQAEASKTADELTYDANLKKLRGEGYDIIAEFTGKDNLDKFVDQFWTLMYQIKNDRELNQYFDDMRAYILDAVNNPQALDKEDAKKKGDEMMQRGRSLWNKFQGKDDADKLLRQGQQLIRGIKSDPVVSKIKEDTEALAKSTFLDQQGRPSLQLTKETLGNLKGVIVPAILDNLSHIPIGRVEGVTDTAEFVFDDLSFSGKDLMPDHVYIKLDADVDFDLKHLSTSDTPQYLLRVEFRGMDAIFNDTKFWFKKTTFPHMEDHGVADVQVKGVTITMKWYSPREGPNANRFTLQKVRCHIYSADVHFKEAKHDILLPMATKLYAGTVRHKLERLIERNLGERLAFVSDKLNQAFDVASLQMQKQYEKVVEKTIQPLITSK